MPSRLGERFLTPFYLTTPDFGPSLLNMVGQTAVAEYLDQPQLHLGGWINRRLEPETEYYCRVVAVDRSKQRMTRTVGPRYGLRRKHRGAGTLRAGHLPGRFGK